MAEPMKRAGPLSDFLKGVFGASPEESIKKNKCVRCKKDADKFDDAILAKEYTITGYCQRWQKYVLKQQEEIE